MFFINRDVTRKVKRFNLVGRYIEFNLKNTPHDVNPLKWLREGIKQIVKYVTTDLEDDDLIGVTFCGKSFTKGPGWLNFKKSKDLAWDDIWGLLSKIYQSNSQGLNTETFCLGVTSVRLPRGAGSRGRKYLTFNEECSKRKGIIVINNKDNLCLPRALVVAKAYVDKSPYSISIRRDIRKLQTNRALELMENADVVIPEKGCGITEIKKFQTYLKDYKISVYQYGTKGRDLLYEGVGDLPKINLIYHEGHYNVITSLTSAFCCVYYCEECHKSYDHVQKHRCKKSCVGCGHVPPCLHGTVITCTECNRDFRGENCYTNHKLNMCEQVKKCISCLKTYNLRMRKGRPHLCGEIYCRLCEKFEPSGHLCYMRPDVSKPPVNDVLYVFYDLESMIESSGMHKPNLCVFEQVCDLCMTVDLVGVCSKCGLRRQILKGDKCVEGLIVHLLNSRKKFKKIIVIAHNGQAYDHQFILNYLLSCQLNVKPELIMRGTKIILMQLDNIKFLDSLNYLPMGLSLLPKAFDLDTNLKKGYFPYLFNTQTNQNYVGALPAIEFYNPDSLKPADRESLMSWYRQHKNETFDLQKELVEYCILDVEILKAACLKFRSLFLKECNVEPFAEAVTIASACNIVYRRNFLKPESIGIIPRNGYRLRDTQSKIALRWLIKEEKDRGIIIQSAFRGREAIAAGYKVDGIWNNCVFEFHGCFFHGHNCIINKRDIPLTEDLEDTLNSRYNKTVEKMNTLREHGYEIVEMWECDFERELTQNPQMYKNVEYSEFLPLHPREAFYGGRTEALKLFYKIQPLEKIHYKDFCSLYPWVCKYGKFPVGHPEVYVGHILCTEEFVKPETDGFIKCKIIPPVNLYHPVLPTKLHKKLLFSLCKTCSELCNANECEHTDDERAFIGTWVIDEVRKALEKGYKIEKIYEIWKYKTVQGTSKEDGLFTKFINTFLKFKQEASGWPEECINFETKLKYLENYSIAEGIQLSSRKIGKNAGMRSMAKLILNSFWGKFGQRENQTKTEIVTEPATLYDMLTNPLINVCHIEIINEETLIVNFENKSEAGTPLATVNVAIAAFTTAQARLKLYDELEKLNERVLYCDTDSVIYISREGFYEPPSGNFLGDLTDELESHGPNSYITEFISSGAKTYAYTVYTPDDEIKYTTVCKFKGITLSHENLKKVNFDVLKDMLTDNDNDESTVVLKYDKISRTKDYQVITKNEVKTFRNTFSKRKRVENFDSLPYGFKKFVRS